MRALLDSFWRAAAYCLHVRVIVLSLLPLALASGLAFGLGYFFWEDALDAVNSGIDAWAVFATLSHWLARIGLTNLRSVLAPLVVVFLGTPVIAVMSLLLVAVFMTPAMLRLVATRRFPLLARQRGGSFLGSVWCATWATAAALLALVVSIPFWLVPPLVLVLPPLIWGWLTFKVMSYDVLAEHASAAERTELLRRHRTSLLGIGIATGFLGVAPSVVWASGAVAVVLAPVLVPVAVWIYTLVFAFSALWFAHFSLSALQALRAEQRGDLHPSPAPASPLFPSPSPWTRP